MYKVTYGHYNNLLKGCINFVEGFHIVAPVFSSDLRILWAPFVVLRLQMGFEDAACDANGVSLLWVLRLLRKSRSERHRRIVSNRDCQFRILRVLRPHSSWSTRALSQSVPLCSCSRPTQLGDNLPL